MPSGDESPPIRPTNVRWVVFSLAFVTSALLYLHRYVFAFIKPTLKEDWGLSNTDLGKIDSAFSITYTVFQFPLALLADVFGVHLLLPGLMIIWCSGLAMTGLATNAGGIWAGQALLGTGQSAVYACLNRLGRIWYPPLVRTTMQGAVGILAGRLGALGASLVFTTFLLGVLGLPWRTAVMWLIGAALLQMLLFVVLFRNSPREHPAVNEAECRLIEGPGPVVAMPSGRLTFAEMFRGMSPRSIRNLLALSLQSTLSTIADNLFSNWIPLFLAQVHHLEFKQMGIYSALPLLGGALAGLAGGGLNDYLIVRTGNRRWARVAIAAFGKGVAAVLLICALSFYFEPQTFCVYLFFVKFFGDWSLTTSWGVVSDIGGRATASVFAFNNSIASLGLFGAPILFGYLSEHFGWPIVFATVSATYLLCALSWIAIDCTVPVLEEQMQPDIPA